MPATQLKLLDVPVANFQSFGGCDVTAHKLRCTDDQVFGNNEPLTNVMWVRMDEPPEYDVSDVRPAQLVRKLWIHDGLWKRCVVL